MKVEIRLGDDTFLVKSGECYSIDYNNTDLNRVSRETFKEFVEQETSTRQFGNGTSGNVVYWYDDKGGMFFVNSCWLQIKNLG